jgi:multidrug efflux pump subunit AcrB
VYETERQGDALSRLDGKPAITAALTAAGGADLGRLSRSIKKELERFKDGTLDFFILSDRGAEEERSYVSILKAALSGALMAAAASACFAGRSLFSALFAALALPFMLVEAAALLSLLGFPLDRDLLAGLAAGAGSAVDATILCSGGLGPVRTIDQGRRALGGLCPGLVSASLTTIAALVPLLALETVAGGISVIAWAVAAITLSALLSSLIFLPPLLLWDLGKRDRTFPGHKTGLFLPGLPRILAGYAGRIRRRLMRLVCRLLALDLLAAPAKPVCVFWLLVTLAGLGSLFLSGAAAGEPAPEDSVYARIEFQAGLLMEEVDQALIPYARSLRSVPGVRAVQVSARPSSGSALISFDPRIIDEEELRELARAAPAPGGFVYIPETSINESIWEISVAGDDDAKCRDLAGEMAGICSGQALVLETVLNFKEGSKRLILNPDRERLARAGIGFSALGDLVRRSVQGPVAYKRIDGNGETDVRVRGLLPEKPSGEDLDRLLVPTGAGPVPLNVLVHTAADNESSSIRREDRRRSASFSVRTRTMDPRKARAELMAVLEPLPLPQGYSVEFDRQAIARAEALSGTGWFFVMALFFCYLVIGAVHESFTLPLAILAVVPPSLALPALCVSGRPLNGAAACAFVAVSGMAVNAAVLCAEALSASIKEGPGTRYRNLRKKLYPLLATSLTTVLGSLPFVFLKGNANTLVRTLALVSTLGVSASALCSFTLLPALAACFPKLFGPGRES